MCDSNRQIAMNTEKIDTIEILAIKHTDEIDTQKFCFIQVTTLVKVFF